MAEGEKETRPRGISDPKSIGDAWHLGNDSNLSATQMTSSGGSERMDTEVHSPPLAVISTRVKSAAALENCANFGTATVRYAYETTNLGRLLKSIGERLRGRKALSMALVVHGSPGCFKLCSQKTVTSSTLREDEELRKFFESLVSTYLNSNSQFARIDILNCPVAQNPEGEQLISDMKKMLGVPVFASNDILGAQITEGDGEERARYSRIGTLYFDTEKLKDWSATSQQTMALFERIRTVGKGAYGAAVLYRKKDDGSHVILKEINLMDLTKTERNLAMNEVQILSRLDHPNIISYYDNFEEGGVLMIEMEYADGGTLGQFLQKQMTLNKPLPERDVVIMFSQMVDALKYLHGHNILHRDLKTANVFLTKEGIVKLGDFGISKILSATTPEANTVLGTPYYISPEICEGKHYDAKSDIWSLGCILYEIVCLQKTFEGTNLPVLVHKIVEGLFTPVRGDYSDGLKELITEMLQKNPELRPSAKDIFTSALPLLMSSFKSPDEEEEEAEESSDTAKTHTKSFLYYLDGVSLLLYRVPASFETRLDHITVGYGHALALSDDGMVFSWGVGSRGQLGHGDKETRRSPQLVESIRGNRITRVECGGEFSVFVTDNGILMMCGHGDHGVQGHGDNNDCLKPKLVEDLLTQDVIQVGCGQSHIAVVTSENQVLMWGAGQHGQLGTSDEEDRSTPVMVAVCSPGSRMPEVIRSVKCGVDGTMFLTDTGRLFACGSNQDNKLGLNRRETFIMQMRKILNKRQLQVLSMSVPTPLKELGKHRVVDMSLGPTHSTVLAEMGHVFTFGRNSEGQLCAGNTLSQNTPVSVRHLPATPTMVTSSELCTIVTTEDNSFLVWGSRPVIKSPLGEILEKGGPSNDEHPAKTPKQLEVTGLKKCGSNDGMENTVFIDESKSGSNTPNRKRSMKPQPSHTSVTSLSPTSSELFSSQNASRSPPPSGDGSPSKASSSDSISKASPKGVSNEGSAFKASSRLISNRSRNPSLNFSEIPHNLVPCANCQLYLKTLNDILIESLDTSRGKVNLLKRESISGTQLSLSHNRRGTSVSTSSIQKEGVILQPTSMDLVGNSGILNLLSVEGITEAKLEGLSCYGSNVLVLIQAQVVDTHAEGHGNADNNKWAGHNNELPTFRIGRKLTQRAYRRKNSFSPSPFHPTPSLYTTLPPPLHSPVSPPLHPPPTLADETTVTEDSRVDTWLRAEFEEAVREKEKMQAGSADTGRTDGHGSTEAWGNRTEQKNEILTGNLKNSTEGIKSNTPVETVGEKGKSPKREQEGSTRTKRPNPQNPSPEKRAEHKAEGVDKPSQPTVFERGQVRAQQIPRMLKPAVSTSSVAETQAEKRGPLNVKRVSSSTDVSQPYRQAGVHKTRGRVSVPVVSRGSARGGRMAGVGMRRLSENTSSTGRGEGGRVEGGKVGEQKHSIQVGMIHPPSQRGGKTPRTSQTDTDVGRVPIPHQSSTDSEKQKTEGTDGGQEDASSNTTKSPTTKTVTKQPSKPHLTGHTHPVTEISPYAEPVPRVLRPGTKQSGKPRLPSASKPAQLQRNSEEKIAKQKKEAEEEKKEREDNARKLSQSQEREKELKMQIEHLQSQLQQQQSQIDLNQNVMKDLQQKVQEMQRPATADQARATSGSPRQGRRSRIGIRSVRSRRRDSDTNSDGGEQAKSRFCTVM